MAYAPLLVTLPTRVVASGALFRVDLLCSLTSGNFRMRQGRYLAVGGAVILRAFVRQFRVRGKAMAG
jgi:hypothetical protein